MAQNAKELFTFTLTGSGGDATYVIDEAAGFTFFSIYNPSAVTGTYIGSKTATQASSALNVAQNVTANITVGNNYVITGVTITAPDGCTLELMGA